MKARTEREIVARTRLHLDIKSGQRGIAKSNSWCSASAHARGAVPFLQTTSRRRAPAARPLRAAGARRQGVYREAYWFLRAVEHRIQMRESCRRTSCRAIGGLAAMATTLAWSRGRRCGPLDEIRDGCMPGSGVVRPGATMASEFNDCGRC